MKKTFAFLALLSLAASSFALTSTAGPSLERILSQMKLRDQEINTIGFQFEQEVTFLNSSMTSKSQGDAMFEKPNKLSVHQKKPQEQLTVADGKKTWMYTPSYKQVWVGNIKKDLASLLPKGMVSINNLGEDLEKNYFITIIPIKGAAASDEPKEIRLSAVPKQPADYKLEFLISTDSWLPKETIYLSSSARVVTRLSSIKVNPVLTEKSFKFVPPPGTDVIPF